MIIIQYPMYRLGDVHKNYMKIGRQDIEKLFALLITYQSSKLVFTLKGVKIFFT